MIENKKEAAAVLLQLWPEHSLEELEQIILEYETGPETAVIAESSQGKVIGIALCSLRHDYVEGCETSPVGYLEGICVDKDFRNQGYARKLLKRCEAWAVKMGCSEFASDCELTNTDSLHFHMRVGFSEENRIICFKKSLNAGQPE